MKEYLNDNEIENIEAFCKNEVMFEAVKKVMLAGIYNHGVIAKGFTPDPLKNGALSLASMSMANPIPNEELGAHIRGVWAGLNALENAYNELQKIKNKKEEIVTPYNEAI
jgi:hypothetical protein